MSDQSNNIDMARAACWILTLASIASMAGRVGGIQSPEKTPMLSANDRSRWCTVRALVDNGTYAIEEIVYEQNPRRGKKPEDFEKVEADPYSLRQRNRHWQTIDMVRHRGPDGREHYYSSKPPLFPTLLAGGYWLLNRGLGFEIADDYSTVIRLLLLIVNVAPMALLLMLTWRLANRYGQTGWGRMFVVAAAAWATFLTTFAVVLNNHLPGAVSSLIAVFAVFRILGGPTRESARPDQGHSDSNEDDPASGADAERSDRPASWAWYMLAGLAAGFSAANELPALSLVAALLVGLGWHDWKRTLLAYVPAAALVGAAFFTTNYLAHGVLTPPYAHREDGAVIAELDGDPLAIQPGLAPLALRQSLDSHDITLSPDSVIQPASGDGRWQLWDAKQQMRWALIVADDAIRLHAWNDWYEYPDSNWRGREKKGVDRGEPKVWVYAIHVLVGHHGIFSLTPIWLFAAWGVVMMLRGAGASDARDRRTLQRFALLTAALSVVCTVFYILRPLEDRNYGGVSCGFRWLYWLIPLWLICLIPAADKLAERPARRRWGVALLTVSIASAAYAAARPFAHPWMYDLFVTMKWIEN